MVQFQLPSKLINQFSNSTLVESSTLKIVELNSTMVLLLLVMALRMAKPTSSSETHGAKAGENQDTSKFMMTDKKVPQVSAESRCNQSTHQSENSS